MQSTPFKSTLFKHWNYKLEQNKRSYMEDDYLVSKIGDNQELYCIFDGHGGREVVDFVKTHFVDIFKKHLLENDKDPEQCLIDTHLELDKLICERFEDVGTTTAVVFVRMEEGERYVYTANVGDSRVIICSPTMVMRLSYDHRAIDTIERERIIKSGGYVSSKRVMGEITLSRALGDVRLKKYVIGEPSTSKVRITNDTHIVIATDGICDVIDDYSVSNTALTLDVPFSICDRLVYLALNRKSTDNMGIIVIQI